MAITTAIPILDALNAIRVKPDQVIEIRALKVPGYKGSTLNVAGYFDDMQIAAEAAAKIDARKPEGVYVVLNDINPDLLARGANRMIDKPNATTADADITRRYWLPIDIDPDRPRGISSSETELQWAVDDRTRVIHQMGKWFGVQPTIRGMSGNGCHLLYRINLPNDEASRDQIKAVLEALQVGATAGIIIDPAVHNAARIWKLYGTTARKGDSVASRPHRLAVMEEYDPDAGTITADQLAAFSPAKAPKKRTEKPHTGTKGIAETVDTLEAYLASKGVSVRSRKPEGSGVILYPECCPLIDDHGQGTDTAFFWSPDGVGFKCLHARCEGQGWKAVRQKIDPGYDKATGTVFEIIDWTPYFGRPQNPVIEPGIAVPSTPAELNPAATPQPAPGQIKRVANFEAKKGSEDEKVIFSVPIDVIAGNLRNATGDWPRRISGKPFVLSGNREIEWLTKTDELFAWMQQFASPHFHTMRAGKTTARDPRTELSCTLVSPSQFFEHIESNATPNYLGYELLPHCPTVENIFYLHDELPKPTGKHLAEFIRRLNPETELDRDLLCAALLTPGWGGPCGARPAFLLTSKHGRGSGKSKTAEKIMQIWGKWISVSSEKTDWKQVRSNLLDDDSLRKRCVYIDNVKARMSGADIESLLTSPQIDGKRMYFGQFSRPNRLTYFITSNHPRMSEDVADRAVSIEIGKPDHGSDWELWVEQYIRDYGLNIIADLLLLLQAPDQCVIDPKNYDRWFIWQSAILTKFKMGNEMAALIKARRLDLNSDRDDAEEIWRAIEAHTRLLGCDLETKRFRISYESIWHLLVNAEAIDKKQTKRDCTRIVTQLAGRGPMKWVNLNPSRAHGRNWLIGNPDGKYSEAPADAHTHVIEVEFAK